MFVFNRTALHWACKRKHISIIQFLLANGADINMKTSKGEKPDTLTSSDEVLSLLGCPMEERVKKLKSASQCELPILPNYLKNPPFPYSNNLEVETNKESSLLISDSCVTDTGQTVGSPCVIEKYRNDEGSTKISTSDERIEVHKADDVTLVKIRVHGAIEDDFIEVEISPLTYQALLDVCMEELDIQTSRILKIRKLPDVLIRKDNDVRRILNGQKLEVVLK